MNSIEANRDAESTVSASSDEAVKTLELGVYPAIPVQDYRDDPIEDIAVHHVRIYRVVDQKATRNKQQVDSVRAVELDFMLDLETLIKETAADPDLIELNCCIEDNKNNPIPNDYKNGDKKLTFCWCSFMVDDRVIVSKVLRYAALNALSFGHPRINQKCSSDAAIYWWPNMRTRIKKNSKTCSAFLNAGKNLKFQFQPELNHRKSRPNNKFKSISPEIYLAKNYNPAQTY